MTFLFYNFSEFTEIPAVRVCTGEDEAKQPSEVHATTGSSVFDRNPSRIRRHRVRVSANDRSRHRTVGGGSDHKAARSIAIREWAMHFARPSSTLFIRFLTGKLPDAAEATVRRGRRRAQEDILRRSAGQLQLQRDVQRAEREEASDEGLCHICELFSRFVSASFE